jgi:AraC-like DNA-binding protein
MYDHQIQEDFFYMMLYGAVAMMSTMASCYLLFRRANAIAPDVTSSVRLRRWTAAFFACMTLSHLWYVPVAFHTSSEEILQCYLVGAMLDFMTLIPCAIVLLLVLLQDRRRPLWPVGVMVAPVIIGLAVSLVYNYFDILPQFYGYHLLLAIGLIIYMVRATRQYGHWLRDNYADLEHKEVWQSFVVFAIILLGYAIYLLDIGELLYEYVMEVINIVLICYLLWRVETLSDLSIAESDAEEETDTTEKVEDNDLSIRNRSTSAALLAKNIDLLLKQHCEEPQLYLQYDISISQLASLIGINRSYLSKHFALQGITYNAYINGLRIQHFIKLYHEMAENHQPVSAQQLAYQSGFRNYNTFSTAFQKMKGMTAPECMQLAKL